ncbi:ORF10 [Barthadenovirus mellis]|uniref:ORF10 n=1 Tax=Passerine adenovirus 1 TaxID=2779174 RepID=A0A7L9DKF6_9ADEN|nr:ORF10 [Passerine adenovirus 1]
MAIASEALFFGLVVGVLYWQGTVFGQEELGVLVRDVRYDFMTLPFVLPCNLSEDTSNPQVQVSWRYVDGPQWSSVNRSFSLDGECDLKVEAMPMTMEEELFFLILRYPNQTVKHFRLRVFLWRKVPNLYLSVTMNCSETRCDWQWRCFSEENMSENVLDVRVLDDSSVSGSCTYAVWDQTFVRGMFVRAANLSDPSSETGLERRTTPEPEKKRPPHPPLVKRESSTATLFSSSVTSISPEVHIPFRPRPHEPLVSCSCVTTGMVCAMAGALSCLLFVLLGYYWSHCLYRFRQRRLRRGAGGEEMVPCQVSGQ